MSERLLDSDFVMIEIMTPTGEPALISQTSFLASSDETKGLNFWSPNPNIPKKLENEVKEKMKRPISEHILSILVETNKSYTFADVKVLLEKAGYKHSSGMVKDNLALLVAAGKLVKDDKECFGVPTTPAVTV